MYQRPVLVKRKCVMGERAKTGSDFIEEEEEEVTQIQRYKSKI